MIKDTNIKAYISIALMISVGLILIYDVYAATLMNDYSPVAENHITENFQVFLLFIAMSIFFVISVLKGTKYKMIFLFFAFLFYSFIMREVDFENLGLPTALAFPFHDIGRNVIAIVVFSAIFIWSMFSDFNGYLVAAKDVIFSKWSLCMIGALAIVFWGQFAEKGLPAPNNELFEEMLEVVGYLGFAICAIDPLGYFKNIREEIR